ncbi:hypothetical protein V1502_10495 [Bacillus sp. SCS-153A]|uniref:hypothetical protein n=1 Tax=Rossellomorea sedimentorum TaxID=3115294 RepID=UPI0039069538
MKKPAIFLVVLLPLLILLGCGSKEEIVTKEITSITVLNISTKEVLYESREDKVLNKVTSKINNSRRTDTWDTLGTDVRLVLESEGHEETYALYYETGDIIVGENKVFTGFDFYSE